MYLVSFIPQKVRVQPPLFTNAITLKFFHGSIYLNPTDINSFSSAAPEHRNALLETILVGSSNDSFPKGTTTTDTNNLGYASLVATMPLALLN